MKDGDDKQESVNGNLQEGNLTIARQEDALWTQVTQTDGSVHCLLCEYIALQTYDDFVSYGYFQ